MASCVAYGCTNRAGKKIPGITFHRFPSNPQLKAAWITAVKRKDWLPTPYSRLCSAHFSDDLFDRSMTRVLLRENAVPSIFPAFPAKYRKIVSRNPSTMGFANASGIDNLTLLTQKISQPSNLKSPINKISNLLESSGNTSENEMSACKRVCELHFVDSDLVKTVNVFDSKTGKRTEYALDQIRLKKDAVPSVFPEILEHHPRTVSLHGHGKRKEMRDDDEDLNLSDNTAITPDILQINSKSAFNNWEKDEISALIALYELETCLYDKKDKNYYNKDERNNAFDRIQQVMTYIRPTCTLNQVKRKILNLRNLYATERLFKDKSIRNGFSTEDTYEPSLWCFRLLQFLDEHIVQTERRRYKKLLIENEANKDIFEDKQSFQDGFETSTLSEKQNVSGESDGDQDEENNRLMKIAEAISENNKKNVTEEISADKDEEHEMLITSSEAVIEGQEDEYNNEPDNDHCESSEDDHQNCQNNEASGLDGENSNNSDRLNEPCRRKKWRPDNSVSTSKKFKTEKKCDKEDIFGRYVSGEMKTLRHNPLLYLKTKQSILKILTEANFKLINTES